MRRVASNTFVQWSASLFFGYWALGFLTPWSDWANGAISGALLISAGIVTFSWLPDTYRVFKSGKVEGAELAVVGVTILALGSCYTGGFSLLWALLGQPHNWLNTPYSGFGRFMMAIGFGLLALSPDATKEGITPPRWYLVLAVIAGVAAAAFVLGSKWGERQEATSMDRIAERPRCTAALPVKGNVSNRGRVYHVPGGAFYDWTLPERCFANEASARAEGFRPAQ